MTSFKEVQKFATVDSTIQSVEEQWDETSLDKNHKDG